MSATVVPSPTVPWPRGWCSLSVMPPDAPPPKVDQRVVRSRAAILAAGRQLYDELGVRGITIEAIVARTGIAKTTVYRHWRSRQDLVVDILEQAAVEFPSISTDDPLGDVSEMLLALWAALAQPMERAGLVGMIESTIGDADLTELHRGFLASRAAPLIAAVTRTLEHGEAAVTGSPQLLADLLASPIIVRAFIRGDPPDVSFVDRLVSAVLGGPATDDG